MDVHLATLFQRQASLPHVQVQTNPLLFPLPVPTRFRRGYRSRQTLISSIPILINLTSSIPISLIPPNSISLIPIRSISSTHWHSVHLLRLLHLLQWFLLLELHFRWSWIDTVVQWRIKVVVQRRNFRNETVWSSNRLMIKQGPWIHIKDHRLWCPSMTYFSSSLPPGLHRYSPAYQSFCRLCCIHSWQFHPCPRSDWREIWLSRNIGTDVHSFALLSFVLLSFSGSRQCFSFGIGSFSFTEGTLLFLNLFPFFFNLFPNLWRTELSWNVLEPWPYLALLRDFEQRALVSLVLFFESVGVRRLVLRYSGSCLLGVNAL